MGYSYKETEYSSSGKVTKWTSSSGANYTDYAEIGREIERGRQEEAKKAEIGSKFSYDGCGKPSIFMAIWTPICLVGGTLFAIAFIGWCIWFLFF